MENQTTKCSHDKCSCQINTYDMEAGYPSKYGEFCSLACQQGLMDGDRCGCGHPECAG